jgi:hypothetical protein
MRRTYISPEFVNNKVYGTFNMVEESNFFGAKMLDIEDSIYLSNIDIIWYQRENNEQLDYSIESTLPSYSYTSLTDKFDNHTLVIDETQPKFQLDKNTRWILTIDLKSILSNYLFATLKKYRTFEGVRNDITLENDVNISMRKYIEYNVINRYKIKSIDLLIKEKSLRNQNLLKYKNVWNKDLTMNDKFTKVESETAFDYSSVKLTFNQQKSSSDYNFEYYFNILFEKI